ncbi:DHHC palmitoyltransferase-domain-containing protein [Apodospora peruviana]|uniref:Palmitoyltransferase n=1 Tax=Apodospora peruviana TaxID=516989 RepID=A0AAE0ITW6_9PEZI|nr:DHHC palmitoyltransferase-domain-containing protein [Apodospora peruviana]
MAAGDEAARPTSPDDNDDSFLQYPQSEIPGPPSIISSRMTDIGTEDGGDSEAHRAVGAQRKSGFYSDGQSRPGTARTGISSRGPWAQAAPLRRGLSGKRVSGTGSISGSTPATRPASSTSRSHVPSLTSHAFFRPMSSQKLQAQRRPTTMSRQMVSAQDMYGADATNSARNSLVSNPVAQFRTQSVDEAEARAPPSRGTEMTEQETLDRITANTSPTHGHNATASGSVTDSVRPLQKKLGDGRNLTVNVDKGYKMGGNLPTPVRTPRSFRSSFLMPGRTESGQNGSNREIEGGEKLESVASSPQLPPKDRADQDASLKDKDKSKRGYNYQYFEGNTVFCLGGRLQNTRHRPVNIATGSMVVLPCVLFFIFSAPWIWFNISPAIPVTFGYLFYVCFSSLVHGSSSDPGILPRNVHQFPPPNENDDPLKLGPPTNDWTLVKSAEKSTAAMEVPTKYCKTCNIWRPPRAHHCRLCDNCIETQDHHCVWFNNCVGRRNYRYFFTFITSATFLGLYLSGACLAQLLVYMNQQSISFGESIDHFRVPFALVIFGVIALLYPAALMGYHLFLMARGETTREYLNSHKFLKKDRYRAFTQGNPFKNWFVVLCRPRPPTYYGFKNKYVAGDQRFRSSPVGAGSEQAGPGHQADSKEGMEMQDVGHSQPGTGFLGPMALRANKVAGVAATAPGDT